MSVGLLLITHAGVGEALLKVATATFPDHPLRVGCLDVGASADPDVIRKNSERMIAELDSGDGVLILTDAYGSTPSNIACALRYKHRTAVVAGLNLRSEEHTSELQSRENLVCRLLLEKKNTREA